MVFECSKGNGVRKIEKPDGTVCTCLRIELVSNFSGGLVRAFQILHVRNSCR